MTKTNSFVKKFIAVVLSVMFALTSFTITGFVPTMEAFATDPFSSSNLQGQWLTTEDYQNDKSGHSRNMHNDEAASKVSWGFDQTYGAVYFPGSSANGTEGMRCYATNNILSDGIAGSIENSGAGTTIAFMAYTSDNTQAAPFFCIYNSSYSSSGKKTLFSLAPNGATVYTNSNGTAHNKSNSDTGAQASANAWHTYVIKFFSSKYMEIWVDGTRKFREQSDFYDNHTFDIPNRIKIGCNREKDVWFNGYIRDFRIYNKDLAAADLTTNMQLIAEETKSTTSGNLNVDKFGIVRNNADANRLQNGRMNICNDQQLSNTTVGIIHFDLSALQVYGYEVENAKLNAKAYSYDNNQGDTNIGGLSYFYTTSISSSTLVSATGVQTNDTTLSYGDGVAALGNVSKFGGNTSSYVKNGSNSYTVPRPNTNNQEIDITSIVKEAVTAGKSDLYFIIMQNTAGGNNSSGGWSDTWVDPTQQSISYSLKERTDPGPDPTVLQAIKDIKDYMPLTATRLNGMTYATNIYAKFPELYKAYVNAQEALDEYTYTGVEDHVVSCANALKQAYNDCGTTTWQTPLAQQQAYYNGTAAYGDGILYCSSSLSESTQQVINNWDEARFSLKSPSVVVMMYTDGTAPSFPVQTRFKTLYRYAWSGNNSQLWYIYPQSTSKFKVSQLWAGDRSTSDNTNSWWGARSNYKCEYTKKTDGNKCDAGNDTIYYSVANKVIYNGTGNTSDYYETFTNLPFDFGAFAGNTSPSLVEYSGHKLASTQYVINYKPLLGNIRNSTYIGYFKNIANYKQGELGKLQEAYKIALAVNPNNRFTAKTGSDGSVAQWVKDTAADIKTATLGFNNLPEVKTDAQSNWPALRQNLDRAMEIVASQEYTDDIYTSSSKHTFDVAFDNAKALMTWNRLTKNDSTSITDDYAETASGYLLSVKDASDDLAEAINNLEYEFKLTYIDNSVSPANTTKFSSSQKATSGKTLASSKVVDPAIVAPYVYVSGTSHNKTTWNKPDNFVIEEQDGVFVNEFTVNSQTVSESCSTFLSAPVRTQDPTCTTPGSEYRDCSKCNHRYVSEVPIVDTAHKWGDWELDTTDTTKHKRVCEYNATHIETDVHHFTPSSEGLKISYVCDECGYTYYTYGKHSVDYGYLDDTDHFQKLGDVAIINEYDDIESLIDECKDLITNRNIEEGEFGYHITFMDAPTLSADGTKLIFEVLDCALEDEGDGFVETDHEEPTCADDGYYEYTCQTCGNQYREVDPATGDHEFDDVVTDPTCTEKGYTTHTCWICEYEIVDTYVDPLGHSWGDWVTDSAATCIAAGSKHHICIECSTREDDEIPLDPNAHNYVKQMTTNADKTYTWTSICSHDANHIEAGYPVSKAMGAYIDALNAAKASLDDENYTQDSRDTLEEFIDGATIDYSSWSKDTVLSTLPSDTTIESYTNTLIKENQPVPTGCLVYASSTITFNFALDGEVNTDESLIKKYNAAKYSSVVLDPKEFGLSSNFVVDKWAITSQNVNFGARSDKVTHIVNGDESYLVYLSSSDKEIANTSMVTIYDRVDRPYDIKYLENGTYTVSVTSEYSTKEYAITLTNTETSTAYKFDTRQFAFYNIVGYKVNGEEVTNGDTVTINADSKIVPKYDANTGVLRHIIVDKGVIVTGATPSTSFWANQDVYTCAWDDVVTIGDKDDTTKYVYYTNDAKIGVALNNTKDFKVWVGSEYSFRACQDWVYITRTEASASDLVPHVTVNYISYGITSSNVGYRDKTITAVCQYYLPEGYSLDTSSGEAAGVVLKTATGSAMNKVSTNPSDYIGATKGVFTTNTFVGGTKQYTINVYNSKTYNSVNQIEVGAVAFLKYVDDHGNKGIIYSTQNNQANPSVKTYRYTG